MIVAHDIIYYFCKMISDNKVLRIAILDMYEGKENQGMRCLREIISLYAINNDLEIELKEFEVRLKNEVPDVYGFDDYIKSCWRPKQFFF
jgi:hypothetical protein